MSKYKKKMEIEEAEKILDGYLNNNICSGYVSGIHDALETLLCEYDRIKEYRKLQTEADLRIQLDMVERAKTLIKAQNYIAR